MRYALVNPAWEFEGSIYFGCREPHLPLELGYARQLLESVGHTVLYCGAHLDSLSLEDVRKNFLISNRTSRLFRRPPRICSGDARRRNCASR